VIRSAGHFLKIQTTFISRALPNRLLRDRSGEPAPGTTPPYPQETTMTTKTEIIRAVNDDLRQNLTVGTAFIRCRCPRR
jgi:hypothetical protein